MSAVEHDERERETESRHEHEQLREEIRRNTQEINVAESRQRARSRSWSATLKALI